MRNLAKAAVRIMNALLFLDAQEDNTQNDLRVQTIVISYISRTGSWHSASRHTVDKTTSRD
jgi:hypothetical protein